jgi:hypothetical protein
VRPAILALMLVVLVAGLAACGGGSDEEGAPTVTATQEAEAETVAPTTSQAEPEPPSQSGGSGESSADTEAEIRETWDRSLEALQEGDAEAYCQALTDRAQDAVVETTLKAAEDNPLLVGIDSCVDLFQVADDLGGQLAGPTGRIEAIDVDGGEAVVEVIAGEESGPVTFVREDGEWLIDFGPEDLE